MTRFAASFLTVRCAHLGLLRRATTADLHLTVTPIPLFSENLLRWLFRCRVPDEGGYVAEIE